MAEPAIRATPGIDIDAVLGWTRALGIPAVAPIELARLGDGKSNLTCLLTDEVGSRWVLRRPPLGKLLPSAHDVAREYRILSSLVDTPVPIARPIALREPDGRIDAPLALMEHVPGLVIDKDAALGGVDLKRRHAIGISLARTLATVHAVDLAAVGLDDLGSHKPYAARQLKRWRRQFEDSKTRDLPLFEEIAGRLEKAAPEQREVTLVHGDYHLLNVITDPDNGSVRAILDWELSTLGDPLADLGGLLAYWPQADDPVPAYPAPFPSRPGFPRREELVEAYAEASGRDVGAVGFWETLGCWKVAAIAEGVLRRRLDDPRNGDPADSAKAAEQMLQRAVLAAERAGI
ncbi:MAG TPA: phosphotransferase family protein [Solirubrobacterales bacterium]|nr:phosphotransferase family protein [Solirubrobacterales bacterium]